MQKNQQSLEIPRSFSSLGGRLCLDFINTLAHRMTPAPDEELLDYDHLILWGREFGILNEEDSAALRETAASSPAQAKRVFQEALQVRESAYAVFSSLCAGIEPSDGDLAAVRDAYGQAILQKTLDRVTGRWTWVARNRNLSQVTWAVAQSVVDLLLSGEAEHVKQCPGLNDCGYLFFDGSKNQTRRWCSMDNCGSRAKMRALYARRNPKKAP